MKKRFWDRKIPSVAALILLFVSVWVTSFLIDRGIFIVGRASPDEVPQNVQVTNITDTSFTVVYTTNSQIEGAVSLQENGEESIIFDDRDKQSGEPGKYYSHFITVADLEPNTSYSFKVIAGGKEYLDNEQLYKISTGEEITDSPPEQNPLVGKIVSPDAQTLGDTLVVATIPGASPIASLTKGEGNYIIPTNSLRTDDLVSYFVLEEESEIVLNFFYRDLTSELTFLYKNAGAIPPVTLEKSYDFSEEEKAPQEAIPSSQLTAPTPETGVSGRVQITIPKKDETFIDAQPVFRGSALPNKPLSITIEPGKVTINATTDRSGNWSARPSKPLSQGGHTITVRSEDS
ncbi:MAG: Ig-like domain-containing protein, partial [bacterium]|nr:Ig-like domain-containing protein [bacterium]